MQLVVADTSPLFYLLSIGQIELLPQLFGEIFIPGAVYGELRHPTAPLLVRLWAEKAPTWLKVVAVDSVGDAAFPSLGAGERAAISLANALAADLIQIDERKGTVAALSSGFEVTGTMGILRLAAKRGWIDLAESFDRLKSTNFRYRQEVMDRLLRAAAGES